MATSNSLGAEIFQQIAGKLLPQEPMRKHVWFGAGGAAELFFEPADIADLQNFLAQKPKHIPFMVIGIGSNMLVRDGGIDGIVIHLGKNFAKLSYQDNMLVAGAAALDIHLAKYAGTQRCAGLEFYAGIPGTIGGAVVMNAGAHGSDTSEHLASIDVIYPDGTLQNLPASALKYSYRHSQLPEDAIILQAYFNTVAGDCEQIQAKIAQIQQRRRDTQPVGVKTGGSTFKNPEGHSAWRLIDEAGLRGTKIGDAMMSEKHCNFMINQGTASGQDLEDLGEYVRAEVLKNSDIQLEWEIKRIGNRLAGLAS